MSELREAAQEALFWMHHARLHLTIKERLHPDGLIQYDNAARNLRAALAQPKTKLRDQHKAFAEWFLQQNPIAPNVEDMAWSAWKAAIAAPENRPCTCHPDDNPPQPCAQRYALTECKALAQPETAEPVAWRTFNGEGGYDYREFDEDENYDEEWRRLNPAHPDWVEPLYAHPPRDEWRPASDPPDNTRPVLIWLKFGDVETFGKTLGGPSGFAFQNGAITHWRDVTPPMEGA